MPTPLVAAAASCALAVLFHFWPRLSAPRRRAISLATSVAGIAFLAAGLQAEGLRESPTFARVVVFAPYVTGTASASASLYYYVMTAVCLLLGFAGLVAGDTLARFFARRFVLSAVAVALLVTVLRILLEKSAAPALLVQAVGITWMAPVAGAYIAVCLRSRERSPGALLRALALYAYSARGAVALVGVAATVLQLGTHYDVSPLTTVRTAFGEHSFVAGSPRQILWLILLPQLLVWPLYTIAAGLLGAGLAGLVMAPRRPMTTAVAAKDQLRPNGGPS